MKRLFCILLVSVMALSMILSSSAVDVYLEGKIIGTKKGEVEFLAEDGEISTGLLGENGTPYVFSDFLWEFDYKPLKTEGEDRFSFLIDPDNASVGYSLIFSGDTLSLCRKENGEVLESKSFERKAKTAYDLKIVLAGGTLSVYAYETFSAFHYNALLTVPISDRTSGAFEVSSNGGHFRLDNFTVSNMGSGTVLYDDVRCDLDYVPAVDQPSVATEEGGGIVFNACPGGSDAYIGTPMFTDGNGDVILCRNFIFEFDYLPARTDWQRDRVFFLMGAAYEGEDHDRSYVVWFQGNQTGAPTFSGYRNNEFGNMRGFAPATYYTNIPCRVRVVVTGTQADVYIADPDFAEFDAVGFTMALDENRPEEGGFGVMTYGGDFELNNILILSLAGSAVETFGIEAAYVKETEPETSAPAEDTANVSDTQGESAAAPEESARPVEETKPTNPTAENGIPLGLIIGIAAAVVVIVAVVIVILKKKKK